MKQPTLAGTLQFAMRAFQMAGAPKPRAIRIPHGAYNALRHELLIDEPLLEIFGCQLDVGEFDGIEFL